MESIMRKSFLEISHRVAWVRVTACHAFFALAALQERVVMNVTHRAHVVVRVQICGIVLRGNFIFR
jgi:hypothetical protein